MEELSIMKRKKVLRSKRWACLALSAALAAGTFSVPYAAFAADDYVPDDKDVYGISSDTADMSSVLESEIMTENLEEMATKTDQKIQSDRVSADKLKEQLTPEANNDPAVQSVLSADDVIKISDAAGLKAIAAAPEKDYVLTVDIDLAGESWTPIPEFSGSLDGAGYAIKNLRVTGASGGLFSTLSGSVKNLTIDGATVGPLDENGNFIHNDSDAYDEAGYIWNGCIAGIMDEGASAEDCTVKDSFVTGTRLVGGMFGLTRGEVTNCSVESTTVKAEAKLSEPGDNWTDQPYEAGGLVGDLQGGNVTGCTVDNVSVSGYVHVGGFTGAVSSYPSESGKWESPYISDCEVNGGTVSGDDSFVGGFAGWVLYGKIQNSSADTSVSGEDQVGGFAGRLGNGSMVSAGVVGPVTEGCRAEGDVTGVSAVGGFAGLATNSTTYDSCATGDVSATGTYSNWAQSCAGGFIGLIGDGTAGFKNCYATGDVEGRKGVGGFTGLSMLRYEQIGSGTASRDYPYDVENYGGIVECYATGDVTATDQYGTSAAGGFAGQLQDNSVPVDCYSTGNVTGYRYVGGFAGSIIGAAAINCYAAGQVECDLEDTAGSFAGMISRPDVRTVCLTNCVSSSQLAGTGSAIGYKHSTLSQSAKQRPGVPADYYWPQVNPEVTVTDLTETELRSGDAFAALNGVYAYGSYDKKTYVEEPKSWDLESTWAIGEGDTTPYLKNADGVQAVVLSGAKAVGVGSETTVTLEGYAGSYSGIGWSVSGAGEKIASESEGKSVTVRAKEDGIISVSVILDGVKAKTLKIVSGTGGEEGMTVSFLSPSPAAGSGSEAYCVDPDAVLKVKFSEAVNTQAFEKSKVTLQGGASNADKTFSYEFAENDTLLTIRPAETLADGQSYTLTIDRSILAKSGLQLVGVNSMQFSVRSFDAPEVTTEINGTDLVVSAEYTNNIEHFDEDMMEVIPSADSADVYITLRYGMGAREGLGGNSKASEAVTMTVASSGGKATVSQSFDLTGIEGTVYVDVYTWDCESGSHAVAPSVTKKIEL